MIRRSLCILSLLLAIVCTVMWIDGYRVVGSATLNLPTRVSGSDVTNRSIHLFYGDGEFGLSIESYARVVNDPAKLQYYVHPLSLEGKRWAIEHLAPDPHSDYFRNGLFSWRVFGFGTYNAGRQGTSVRVVQIPQWFAVAVFLLWPVITVIKYLRRPQRQQLCRACGYDMRGSPSGICPECGENNINATTCEESLSEA